MPPSALPALIHHAVPLAQHTTFGVGGTARFFADVRETAELQQLLAWQRAEGLPLFVLGGGSNVLISDAGFGGLMLRIGVRGITFEDNGDRVLVTVGAGESWDDVVAACVARGLAGIECLSGIPGRAGAAPVQNIGAYGQEVAETIVAVDVVRVDDGAPERFSNASCAFAYRTSAFKRELAGAYIVTAVTFALTPGGAATVRYPDVEKQLASAHIKAPTLHDVRAAVLAVRRGKSMLLDPLDPDARSAGSFFTNPIIPDAAVPTVRERARVLLGDERAAAMPLHALGDGTTKLVAAWLIEQAGFQKGFVLGNAGVSSKHALALVNRGGARAAEIVDLARTIQRGVFEAFEVRLEPEPVLVGVTLERA